MISTLKSKALFWVISLAFRKPCTNPIVMAGEGADKKDCYVVYIFREDGYPFLLVDKVDDKKVYGKAIQDGYGYDTDATLDIASIKLRQLVIEHYYKLMTLRFTGLYGFLFSRFSGYHYIKYHLLAALNKVDQHRFNRKKLVIVRKQQLLQLLVERCLETPDVPISPMDLMTRLHSLKWVNHPDSENEQQRLHFYLKALVADQNLTLSGHGYKLEPRAILTLEALEEEVRRHTELASLQRRLVFVTWALVFVTSVLALSSLWQIRDMLSAP